EPTTRVVGVRRVVAIVGETAHLRTHHASGGRAPGGCDCWGDGPFPNPPRKRWACAGRLRLLRRRPIFEPTTRVVGVRRVVVIVGETAHFRTHHASGGRAPGGCDSWGDGPISEPTTQVVGSASRQRKASVVGTILLSEPSMPL